MRPIQKPAAPVTLPDDYEAIALALGQATGNYCAFCEKSLDSYVLLWHKQRGSLADSSSVSRQDWDKLLLICGDCTTHAQALTPSATYWWPDSATTTQLQPYVYSYLNTERITLGPDGTPQAAEVIKQVLVSVRTDLGQDVQEAAWNTLKLFQLNGAFFNNDFQKPVITLPYKETFASSDYRLSHRLGAYERAAEAGRDLSEVIQTVQPARGFISSDQGFIYRFKLMLARRLQELGFESTCRQAIYDSTGKAWENLQPLFPARQPSGQASQPGGQAVKRPRTDEETQDELERKRRKDDNDFNLLIPAGA